MMKRSSQAKLTHLLGDLPVRLHFRSDLHLMRKLWHITMGLMIAFIYMSGISKSLAITLLASFLGFDLFMETLRLRSPAFNEKMLRFWKPLLRNEEINRLSSVPHFLVSIILAILIFPAPVATLAILYLACGDPIASFFGILYGHLGPRFKSGKTWVGSAAGVLVCIAVTFIYLRTLTVSGPALWGVAIAGGLAGGTTELLPLNVDDNFSIPLVSGFVLWLAFMVAGI